METIFDYYIAVKDYLKKQLKMDDMEISNKVKIHGNVLSIKHNDHILVLKQENGAVVDSIGELIGMDQVFALMGL